MLTLDGIDKSFGGVAAARQVSLSLRRGELHALIGPNGAGKSTLIHLIAGTLRPDSGSVWLNEQNITKLSAHQRVRCGLGRSYQTPQLLPELTALDNVLLALQAPRYWGTHQAPHSQGIALLQRVGLSHLAEIKTHQLAHGERRLLDIALALAHNPPLLLLDEPLAGLGRDESARAVQLIESFKGQHTILLVEHDVDAVIRLADRISVLVEGQRMATGTPAEIRSNAEVQAAYLGESPGAKNSPRWQPPGAEPGIA